jgi:site-specific DNA recombinase
MAGVHIYTRISSSDQEDGYGLDVQEQECRRWCAERGLPVASCVHEIWTGKDRHRPQLDALIHRLEPGDVALFHRASRLSRGGALDTFLIKDRIQNAGATMRFVEGDVEDGDMGEVMLALEAWKESRDRDQIIRQTQAGMRARVASGKPLVGGKPPFGYIWAGAGKTRLDLDPETAPVARMIFDWALEGISIRGIVQRLEDRGIPSPMGKRFWSLSRIRSLLLRPTYSGTIVAYREQVTRAKGGGYLRRFSPPEAQVALSGIAPAIVTAEEQAAIRERLVANKAYAARNNRHPEATLLRAGFIFCGHCGHAMHADWHRIQGGRYRCARTNRERHNCPLPSIIAKHIDPLVWEKASDVLRDPAIIARKVERRRDDGSLGRDIAAMEKRLNAITQKQERLAKRVAEIEDDAVAALLLVELKALAEQRVATERERDEMRRRIADRQAEDARVLSLADWCATVNANLETLTYDEKRLALGWLGVQVRVYRPGATDDSGTSLPRWEVTMAPAQTLEHQTLYPTAPGARSPPAPCASSSPARQVWPGSRREGLPTRPDPPECRGAV